MYQQPQSRWGLTGRQLLWASGIVAALTIAVLVGYRYGITLWDWIKLLIVPAVIAGGGLWFNVQQREREQRIASERARDEALQGYLDGMSQLLTDKEQPLHRAQSGDSLSTVARARTLTVLGRLDSSRKRSVLQFLYESRLIEGRNNIVSLQQADLSGADLRLANLRVANLIEANLRGADLIEADLSDAYLREANLFGADLREADLRGTNLSHAKGVTNEQLSAAKSLEGATMPDGQTLRGDKMPNGPTFEDWLKDRESREGDGEDI